MKIAFISNFYNHHQAPLANCLNRELNGGYAFISTEKITEERLAMGWGNGTEPNFVHHYEEEVETCDEIINKYDVVIIGAAPYSLIKKRLKAGKLTFLYSERIFKKKPSFIKMLKYKIQYYFWNGRFKNFYLLSASAFSYSDYLRVLSFKDRAYEWGYFPKTYFYEDINEIINSKEKDTVNILYVSRLIELKHPELPVFVARRLKEDGINFHLTIVGTGVLKEKIIEMVGTLNLQNEISFIDGMKPDGVRKLMIQSNIFLFTSDRNEGWGAVINEAMNSCCSIVASSAIGSIPFLLKNNVNGFIYEDGDFEDLYSKTKELCLNKDLRRKFGIEAFNSITKEWCAEVAAKRFICLSENLLQKNDKNEYDGGPCSKASIIKDDWLNK